MRHPFQHGSRFFFHRLIGTPVFGTPDLSPPSWPRRRRRPFEGIAAGVVEVPAGRTGIGDRAFRGCPDLTYIRIPAGRAPGTDVFDTCGTVYMFSAAGSPAEAYRGDPAHGSRVFVPIE